MATLDTRLSAVIGDRTAKVLTTSFGMASVSDLLRHYPRRYVVRGELTDISTLLEGDEATVLAEIQKSDLRRVNGRVILEVVLTDGTSKLWLTFFNQAWRQKELQAGRTGLFAGKVGVFNGKKQLSHPDYLLIPDGNNVDEAIADFAGKYIAVYPATAKMPSWKIAQCMDVTLASLDEIQSIFPVHFFKKIIIQN